MMARVMPPTVKRLPRSITIMKLFVMEPNHSAFWPSLNFSCVCEPTCTPAVSAVALKPPTTPGACTKMPVYRAVAGVAVW